MRTIYISVDSENVVVGWATSRGMDSEIEIKIEEEHPFLKNSFAYRYVDGVLYYDAELADRLNNPEKMPDPVEVLQQEVAELKAIMVSLLGPDVSRHKAVADQVGMIIAKVVTTQTPEQAIETPDLYPAWKHNTAYAVGQIVSEGKNAEGKPQLYQVIQAHTSQRNWLPKNTPALYKAIGFTGGGTAVWVQPLGAHDAYKKGDVVSHKTKLWTSDVDGNVWEPGVYGWTVKTAGAAANNR